MAGVSAHAPPPGSTVIPWVEWLSRLLRSNKFRAWLLTELAERVQRIAPLRRSTAAVAGARRLCPAVGGKL